ncbi:MAG: hypothetical protein IH991_17590 [Planctomycetes bacterium]|nr:hypothetical protein [Planctomycetota bacterium]
MHSSDDKIDEVVRRRFEAAWAAGTPPPIESFVSAGDQTSFLPTLEELVLVEMEFAWKAWAHRRKLADPESARPTSVEEYLQRFPQLNSPDVLQRLVEQEFSVRNQCGDRPDVKELEQRFPVHSEPLTP